MKFNPEEAIRLIEEGETDIKVSHSIDYIAKESKKESIRIIMQAWDKNGKEGTITAYISHTWQLKAVCLCLGVSIDIFNSGEIPAEHFEGLVGKIINKIEKSTDPRYEDKNVVAKWLKKEEETPGNGLKPEIKEFKDDDIPW